MLAGIVAALAFPAVAGAEIFPDGRNNPDAVLHAVAAWQAANQLVLDTPDEDYDQDVFDGLCDAEGEALEVVRLTPATTIEGIRAKASVLNVVIRRYYNEAIANDCLEEEIGLALSLCTDLLVEAL